MHVPGEQAFRSGATYIDATGAVTFNAGRAAIGGEFAGALTQRRRRRLGGGDNRGALASGGGGVIVIVRWRRRPSNHRSMISTATSTFALSRGRRGRAGRIAVS
jgi:hypothetical protein